MKRKTICSLALTLLMLLSCLCAAYADTGSVTYDGDAQSFVFLPGSAREQMVFRFMPFPPY